MSGIILYDLPSKGRNSCWTLNPWKIRLALNFKGLDYRTVWVEYPDIEETLSRHIPPNEPPAALYTIPAIQIGTEHIMDSHNIAARLEEDYPVPSMHLDSPLLPIIYKLIPNAHNPLRPIFVPQVSQNLLNPRSVEYFTRTREAAFGKTFAQLQAESRGDEAWMEATPSIKALGELLKKEGGPFFMGETTSYADFVVVGWLKMYHRIDVELFNHVIAIEPRLEVLFDACKLWLERDDH